jgi:ankyrin repeat protein
MKCRLFVHFIIFYYFMFTGVTVMAGVNPERVFSDKKVIALCNAAQEGDVSKVRRLIQDGVNVNAVADQSGGSRLTPVAFAGMAKTPDALKELVKAGAQVNVQYEGGTSPLFFAMNKPHAFTEVLLAAGANPNTVVPSGTILGEALANGNIEAARLLLVRGAHSNVNYRGDPLLLKTLYWGLPTATNLLLQYDKHLPYANESNEFLQEFCTEGAMYLTPDRPEAEFHVAYISAWKQLEARGVKLPCSRPF